MSSHAEVSSGNNGFTPLFQPDGSLSFGQLIAAGELRTEEEHSKRELAERMKRHMASIRAVEALYARPIPHIVERMRTQRHEQLVLEIGRPVTRESFDA